MKGKTLLLILTVISATLIISQSGYAVTGVIHFPSITVRPLRTDVTVDQSFSVLVNIVDASEIHALQFYLGWNTTVLEETSWTEGDFLSGGGVRPTEPFAKVFNDQGVLKFVNTIKEVGGASGSGTIANVTFRVRNTGATALLLHNVLLQDSLLLPITNFLLVDGYVNVTPPKFSVDPDEVIDTGLRPGDSFAVNVTLNDVVGATSFEFGLYYNATTLNATAASGFHFLDLPDNETVYINRTVVNGKSHVWVFMNSTAETTKSGPVVNITFTVLAIGESDLEFRNIKLFDALLRGYTTFVPEGHHPPSQNGFFSNVPAGHDMQVLRAEASSTQINVGDHVIINATLRNIGAFNESSFNLTATYSSPSVASTVFDTKTGLSLTQGDKTSITFDWNTAGIAPGLYTVRVTATINGTDVNLGNNVAETSTINIGGSGQSNLLLYAGIGAAIVIVVVVAFLLLRRSRKPK